MHLWEAPSLHPMATLLCGRVMAVYVAGHVTISFGRDWWVTRTKPPHVFDFLCEFSQKLQPVRHEQQNRTPKLMLEAMRLAKDGSHRVWLCLCFVSSRSQSFGYGFGYGFVLAPVSRWKWAKVEEVELEPGCSCVLRLEMYLMCGQSEDLTFLFPAALYSTSVVCQIPSLSLSVWQFVILISCMWTQVTHVHFYSWTDEKATINVKPQERCLTGVNGPLREYVVLKAGML